jgi:hypothetical protein
MTRIMYRQVNYTGASVSGVDGGSLHSSTPIDRAVVLSHHISRAGYDIPSDERHFCVFEERGC